MTHPVIVTQKAKDDLRHYYAVAAEHALETGARWLNRFEEALQTLSESLSKAEEEEEEEDMDIPVKEEIEEDIPLTKSGYNEAPSYPHIQVTPLTS